MLIKTFRLSPVLPIAQSHPPRQQLCKLKAQTSAFFRPFEAISLINSRSERIGYGDRVMRCVDSQHIIISKELQFIVRFDGSILYPLPQKRIGIGYEASGLDPGPPQSRSRGASFGAEAPRSEHGFGPCFSRWEFR